MAEFVPFSQHVLVRIRLIVPEDTMIAQDFATLAVGYDPSGHGAYVLGQGANRTRFNRADGRERVGPKDVARWEIVPEYAKLLPAFETTRDRAAREDARRKAAAEAARAKRAAERNTRG